MRSIRFLAAFCMCFVVDYAGRAGLAATCENRVFAMSDDLVGVLITPHTAGGEAPMRLVLATWDNAAVTSTLLAARCDADTTSSAIERVVPLKPGAPKGEYSLTFTGTGSTTLPLSVSVGFANSTGTLHFAKPVALPGRNAEHSPRLAYALLIPLAVGFMVPRRLRARWVGVGLVFVSMIAFGPAPAHGPGGGALALANTYHRLPLERQLRFGLRVLRSELRHAASGTQYRVPRAVLTLTDGMAFAFVRRTPEHYQRVAAEIVEHVGTDCWIQLEQPAPLGFASGPVEALGAAQVPTDAVREMILSSKSEAAKQSWTFCESP